MSVERSQGKRRARIPRPGESALTAATVLAGPIRNTTTGRFVAGNTAAKLRALKRAHKLVTMNPAKCAPWVRPYIELARREVSELVEELGAEGSPSLMAFAEDAATACALHRAYLAIAVANDVDAETKAHALSEARQWQKERRASLLSLRDEARAGAPKRPAKDATVWAALGQSNDDATEREPQ